MNTKEGTFAEGRRLIRQRMEEVKQPELKAFYRYMLITIDMQEQMHADFAAGIPGQHITLMLAKALGNLVAGTAVAPRRQCPYQEANHIMMLISQQAEMCLQGAVTSLGVDDAVQSSVLH